MAALPARLARVLVIGDAPLYRRCADAADARRATTSLERTFRDATTHLAASDCDALVASAKRADGSALDWIVSLRDQPKWEALPVLVVGRRFSPSEVTRGFELGVSFLCRPISTAHIQEFFSREDARAGIPGAAALEDLAQHHGLSRREMQLLAASLSGLSRVDFIAHAGISLNTYKSLARRLLRKLRACSIGEIRDRLLRSSAGAHAKGAGGVASSL